MKKGLLLLFVLCSVSLLTADAKDSKKKQKKTSHYIKGFGWGTCTDLGTVQPYAKYYTDHYNSTTGSNDTSFEGIGRPVGLSFFTLGWNNHFNIKEFGKEKSLSINFYPSLGVDILKNRMLDLTLPLMLCYNTGNVSTYSSKRDIGWTVGLGMEYIMVGMIKISDDLEDISDGTTGYYGTQVNILQPCANLGLRYFTGGGHAQELNVKFGMHKDNVYDKYGKLPAAQNLTYNDFWVRLTVVHYINY